MKKIALYIPSMKGGGAEKVVALLSSYLASKDSNKVYLIVIDKEGVYWDLVSNKVEVVNLNKTRVLSSILPLAIWIRKNKPDVLFSAINYVNIAASLSKAISGYKCKVILSEHGKLPNPSSFRNLIFLKLMSVFYRESTSIVAVSQGIKDSIVKKLKVNESKVIVINNPVYPEYKTSDKINLSNYFKTPPSKLIMSIGRLEPVKNYLVLLQAFKLLDRKDLALVILGDGSEKDLLTNYIENNGLKERVLLLGFIKDPYIWLNTSDLFVSSSNSEAFGNALVEAMAYGLRIVSTNCTGPNEILDNGKFGTLVPINSTTLLAEAIGNALSDSNKVKASEVINKAKCYSQKIIFPLYDNIL